MPQKTKLLPLHQVNQRLVEEGGEHVWASPGLTPLPCMLVYNHAAFKAVQCENRCIVLGPTLTTGKVVR
jgi:hypothetical protein